MRSRGEVQAGSDASPTSSKPLLCDASVLRLGATVVRAARLRLCSIARPRASTGGRTVVRVHATRNDRALRRPLAGGARRVHAWLVQVRRVTRSSRPSNCKRPREEPTSMFRLLRHGARACGLRPLRIPASGPYRHHGRVLPNRRLHPSYVGKPAVTLGWIVGLRRGFLCVWEPRGVGWIRDLRDDCKSAHAKRDRKRTGN